MTLPCAELAPITSVVMIVPTVLNVTFTMRKTMQSFVGNVFWKTTDFVKGVITIFVRFVMKMESLPLA
jgi:hypothetical protein